MSFPVILNLLTLGTVICIPIVHVKEHHDNYDAAISIIHAERETEQLTQRAFKVQSALLERVQEAGADCLCTRYFTDFVSQIESHRNSTDPNRIVHLIQHILKNLNLEEFQRHDYPCFYCQRTFAVPDLQNAIETINLMLKKEGTQLIKIAGLYERWLLSDAMNLIKNVLRLEKPIRVRKNYQYL